MLDAADIRVSIIVPGYNDGEYIARALESCTTQTHGNLQIVAVDDGSTDDTLQAMERFARIDPRITVVALPQNRGAHNARRAGLEQATGQLVMFLDGDDELAPETAARAAAEFAQAPYDILHFATRATTDGGKVAQARVKAIEKWFSPVSGELYGRKILTSCFKDHAYAFSVACKAYPAPLVRRAFDALGDVWADAGEDALEYFAISFFAEIYRGLPQCRFYTYHLGDGASEHEGQTAEEFQRSLRLIDHVEAIEAFLDAQGPKAHAELADVYEFHWNDQLGVLLRNWLQDVRPQDKLQTLEAIMDRWPKERVIDALAAYGSPAMGYVCELLGPDAHLTPRQMWAWGQADGRRQKEGEYEKSGSYRLGRILSALPRKVLGR